MRREKAKVKRKNQSADRHEEKYEKEKIKYCKG